MRRAAVDIDHSVSFGHTEIDAAPIIPRGAIDQRQGSNSEANDQPAGGVWAVEVEVWRDGAVWEVRQQHLVLRVRVLQLVCVVPGAKGHRIRDRRERSRLTREVDVEIERIWRICVEVV